MTGKKLRDQYISAAEKTVLVICVATVWDYEDGVAGWITQLVDARLFNDVTVVGLISSHPAACSKICQCQGTFIRDSAEKVLDATTIEYLKSMTNQPSLVLPL